MMDKRKKMLLNNVSKLDAITDSCGEITKLATEIIDENSKVATRKLLKVISGIVDNTNYKTEVKSMAQLVNSNLIEYYGYVTLRNIL